MDSIIIINMEWKWPALGWKLPALGWKLPALRWEMTYQSLTREFDKNYLARNNYKKVIYQK
ncbi:hypothetical protein [Methanosarcina sp.]|uniref:hypothetical protein n=1 Tax=Methanosarcina sp. TaxID=2213 RepID=UPI003C7792F0